MWGSWFRLCLGCPGGRVWLVGVCLLDPAVETAAVGLVDRPALQCLTELSPNPILILIGHSSRVWVSLFPVGWWV